MSAWRPATRTQIAQIVEISRRRGITVPSRIDPITREDADRLIRALLYIDGDRDLDPDPQLVEQLEATREERPMEERPADKTCSRCKETKPVDEFGSNKSTPDGLSYYCKACNRDIYRERKAKTRAKRSAQVETPEPPTPEPVVDSDADEPHWCIAELRDPRLSTIEQARKILVAKFGDVGLQDTAEVLAQIADLDLA